jgi:ABC-type microcin C transport system permease subunit YejB
MIRFILFNALLFGSCGYALLKGTRDARIIATTCLVAAFASFPFAGYGSVELTVFVVDAVVLALFLYVALQSDRFWPLWIAGLHLTTMVGHALKLVSDDLVPIAYAVALRLWAYPELIILAVAVWRGTRRDVRVAAAAQPT